MPGWDYTKTRYEKHPVSGVSIAVGTIHHRKVNHTDPNFAKLEMLGARLPCAPYQFLIDEVYSPLTAVRRTRDYDSLDYTTYDRAVDWSVYCKFTYGNFTEAQLQNRALTKLYSNLKGFKSELGVATAETEKVISMVTEAASKIAGVFQALKHRDLEYAFKAFGISNNKHQKRLRSISRNTRNSAVFASKAFLELSYGWKPLLVDVYNAATDYATKAQVQDSDFHVSSFAKDISNIRVSIDPGSVPSKNNLHASTFGSGDYYYLVRYDLYYRVSNQTLRRNSSLGLTNPLSIGWELLPFSFVVDWFAPVGDWLEATTAEQGLTFVDGSMSVMRKRNFAWFIAGSQTSDTTAIKAEIHGVMQADIDYVQFNRTVLTSIPPFPNPIDSFRLAGAMHGDRALKALALLASVFL